MSTPLYAGIRTVLAVGTVLAEGGGAVAIDGEPQLTPSLLKYQVPAVVQGSGLRSSATLGLPSTEYSTHIALAPPDTAHGPLAPITP
ncbi:MAG TPA: hypothetical protein VFZ09_51245 [Archangium sp.]|uniref:hypothetical protein n=1 Tax=Archangium sp. TaxID=1872627 RepID=UPI002E3308E8|nr:hypothetical protein [Archangium sp.]HEX5754664.1 hypothetical protein [Archangium sp.]